MSFVEIVNNLHSDYAVVPQFARIFPDTTIQYAFMLRGFHDILTGHVLMPNSGRRHTEVTDSVAALLKLQLGHYGINLDVDGSDSDFAVERKITLSYKPKSEDELARIRSFLESIPEDNGKLPNNGKDFFCYT